MQVLDSPGTDDRVVAIILGAERFPKAPQIDDDRLREAFAASQRDFSRAVTGLATAWLDRFNSRASPSDLCREIATFLTDNESATDLVIYYVGHGGFLVDGAYYLALHDTEAGLEHATALRAADLAATVRTRFASKRTYMILDCCFAGSAVPHMQAPLGEILERATKGVAFLNAASKDKAAFVPDGAPRTMFSDCLCDVLASGVPGAGARLSLRALHAGIVSVLKEKYLDQAHSWPEIHEPKVDAGTSIADYPLFPNAAPSSESADSVCLDAVQEEWAAHLDDAILLTMGAPELPYPDEVLDLRRKHSQRQLAVLGDRALRRYIQGSRINLTDAFLVACCLREAIQRDDPEVCRHRQFVFPVHQFLSGMIRGDDAPERDRLLATLVRWLGSRADVFATARDFAAFELGMCRATVALPALVESLANPFETLAVRYYSAMAIGMLRARAGLRHLLLIYASLERGSPIRAVVAHAIIFTHESMEQTS